MRAAIYCPVSPDTQGKASLQGELAGTLAYCRDRSYQVAHRFAGIESGLVLIRPLMESKRDLGKVLRNVQS